MELIIFAVIYLGCGIFGSWVLMKFLNSCGYSGCALGGDDLFMIYFLMPLFWWVFLPVVLLIWGNGILKERYVAGGKLSWPRRLYDKVNGNT